MTMSVSQRVQTDHMAEAESDGPHDEGGYEQ